MARLYGKNESSIREVMKNKEKIRTSFFFPVTPQTAEVAAVARDKVLMKVEKALNFWVEDMNRKRVSIFITLYYYFFIFFSPGATTPIGRCILQPSSGL